MNLRTVTRGDAAIAAAALLLLVSSFLPFYSASASLYGETATATANAWHSSFFPLLPAVYFTGIVGAVLVLLPRVLNQQEPRAAGIPVRHWGVVLAVASLWSALWALFGAPDGASHDYGAFLTFVFALALAVLALLAPMIPALAAPLVPDASAAHPVQQAQPGQPFHGPQQQQPYGAYGYPQPGFQQPMPQAQPQAQPYPQPQPQPQAAEPTAAQPVAEPVVDEPVEHGTVRLGAVKPAASAEPADAVPADAAAQQEEEGDRPVDISKPAPAAASGEPAFAPFWFAVPATRPLAPESDPNGTPVGQLVPGTWYLAIAQAGEGLLTQTQEGKRGLLADTSGIQRG